MGQGVGQGLARFLTDIARYARITVDTCGCIYFLERESKRFPLARELFLEAARGHIEIELAGITLTELLVHPFQSGDRREIEVVLTLAKRQAGVRTTPLTESVLIAAAQVRAATRLKVPDALVVASAAISGCGAIVGNDQDFEVINKLAPMRLVLPGARALTMPRYLHFDDYLIESAEPVTIPRRTS